MLIKANKDQYFVLPDDIAEMIIADPTADPSMEDVPDFSAQEINTLVHSSAGFMMDTNLTLEENFAMMRKDLKNRQQATEKNILKARTLIEKYNNEITINQIGVCDFDEIFQTEQDQLQTLGKF